MIFDKKWTVGVKLTWRLSRGGGRTSLLLPPGAENPSYATATMLQFHCKNEAACLLAAVLDDGRVKCSYSWYIGYTLPMRSIIAVRKDDRIIDVRFRTLSKTWSSDTEVPDAGVVVEKWWLSSWSIVNLLWLQRLSHLNWLSQAISRPCLVAFSRWWYSTSLVGCLNTTYNRRSILNNCRSLVGDCRSLWDDLILDITGKTDSVNPSRIRHTVHCQKLGFCRVSRVRIRVRFNFIGLNH